MFRNHLYRKVSILALSAAIAGCAFQDDSARFQGAREIVEDKPALVLVDLPSALVDRRALPEEASADTVDDLEAAFHNFYLVEGANDQALRRNRVQDRLIAASNESCKDFKEKLQQLQSEGNFFLGGITTALAGAGAIVTGALGSRALAGSAGITSGIRAEFNDAYFAQKAVEVLTKAFEARRVDILAKIDTERDGKDLEDYPVERAVADALTYHAACNLISGLEEASDRVTTSEAENIGLARLKQVFDDAGIELTVDLEPAPEEQ